jgi:hypothetical protein
MKRLGKHVLAVKTIHAAVEEFLYASLSVRSLSYQRKVADYFFPELLILIQIAVIRMELDTF